MSDLYTSDEIGLQTYRLVLKALDDHHTVGAYLPTDPAELIDVVATMMGFWRALEASGFPVRRAAQQMINHYERNLQ